MLDGDSRLKDPRREQCLGRVTGSGGEYLSDEKSLRVEFGFLLETHHKPEFNKMSLHGRSLLQAGALLLLT
jgi:hypothetical protein